VSGERRFPDLTRLEIVDQRVAALAERQHGVVSTRQLAALGL